LSHRLNYHLDANPCCPSNLPNNVQRKDRPAGQNSRLHKENNQTQNLKWSFAKALTEMYIFSNSKAARGKQWPIHHRKHSTASEQ